MKRSLIIVLLTALALGCLALGCSSPEKQRERATERFQLVWKAREFAHLCMTAVQPGMNSRQVLFNWGSPVDFRNEGKTEIWIFEIEKMMYFRGWDDSDGAQGHGNMVVTLESGRVVNVEHVRPKKEE